MDGSLYGGGIWEYLRSDGKMTKHNGQLGNLPPAGGRGNRFGIIQLSDLQFGEKHIFKNSVEFSEKLLGDIKKMSGEYDFTPLYIVLSGDITEKGETKEFEDAASVIEGILRGLNIDRMNILCVPGNHDVNWDLCKSSQEFSSDQLKFQPYNEFVAKITQGNQGTERVDYPLIKNPDFEIEFLLLNSCEKVDQANQSAYICKEKLTKTLKSKKEKECLRIVVAHHPLQQTVEGELKEIMKADDANIRNAAMSRLEANFNLEDIKAIIHYHECDIILTGHTHKAHIDASVSGNGHQMVFAGCGSTGIQQQQRGEGIRNQYSIHVIDFEKGVFQSIWRAFNPTVLTELGRGRWTEDDTVDSNPSKYQLQAIKRARPISSQTIVETSSTKLIDPNKVDWSKDEIAKYPKLASFMKVRNE